MSGEGTESGGGGEAWAGPPVTSGRRVSFQKRGDEVGGQPSDCVSMRERVILTEQCSLLMGAITHVFILV